MRLALAFFRAARLRLVFALVLGVGGAWSASAASAPAAAPDDSKILFPAGSPSSSSRTESSSSGLGSMSLVLGLALAAVGGWLVWRGRGGAPLGRGKLPQSLVIAETRSLGNRQYLVVATYEDKKFLLGVTPGQIQLLAPLPDAPANSSEPRRL